VPPCTCWTSLWAALRRYLQRLQLAGLETLSVLDASSLPARELKASSFLLRWSSPPSFPISSMLLLLHVLPVANHGTWGMLNKHLSANPRIAALFWGVAEACVKCGHCRPISKIALGYHSETGQALLLRLPSRTAHCSSHTWASLVEKMLSRASVMTGCQHVAFQPNQFGAIPAESTEDAGVFSPISFELVG